MTCRLTGLSLKSALWLVLRDLDLTYVVSHEVMLITTTEVADTMMETRVYGIDALGDVDSDAVAQVIEQTIRPETWRTATPAEEATPPRAGASKPVRLAAIQSLPGCLVITQSQHAHEEIAALLGQLQRHASVSGTPPSVSGR